MKKMLAAAAIVSLSLTGASWAQSSGSSNSPGSSDSGSQQGETEGTTDGDENASDNSAGDEPQCPPGQKSADSSATKADPNCVAE